MALSDYTLRDLIQMYPTADNAVDVDPDTVGTVGRVRKTRIIDEVRERFPERPMSKRSIIAQAVYAQGRVGAMAWATENVQTHPALTFGRNIGEGREPLSHIAALDKVRTLINAVGPYVDRMEGSYAMGGKRDVAAEARAVAAEARREATRREVAATCEATRREVAATAVRAKAARAAEAKPAKSAVSREWALAARCIGKHPYTLLYGPPGTGKTRTAIYTLRENGAERVVNVYITPETTAAELMGFTAPDSTGAFSWKDGPITAAMRNGWPVVINEIDDVTGDAETALMGIMDDQDIAQYELMSGEVIRPAKGFAVVATMNSNPDVLRPALLDRLPIRFQMEVVHPGAFDRLPVDIRKAAQKATAIKDGRKQSIRAWIAFGIARDEWGLSEDEAAQVIWQNHAKDMLNVLRMERGH